MDKTELSGIATRFLEVIAEKGYSHYRISKEVKLFTESKLSHIKTGRNQPSDDMIETLLEKFPDVDRVWLLTGVGKEDDDIINDLGIGVPMYNVLGSAGGVELYNDLSSYKTVGHLNFPGATKDSFALPVYGNSMFPTLEDGSWAVLRPIMNKFSIIWGQVYYIEYGDYRLYKRLLAGDEEDDVILWSDNQEEKINGKPIHTQIKIKKAEILRICIVTDKYKKSNN